MTRLSGAQAQALVWVAYREGVKPTNRALRQIKDMGLCTSPSAHDANWRLTQDGGRELRAHGLARATANTRPRSLPKRQVA